MTADVPVTCVDWALSVADQASATFAAYQAPGYAVVRYDIPAPRKAGTKPRVVVDHAAIERNRHLMRTQQRAVSSGTTFAPPHVPRAEIVDWWGGEPRVGR